MMETWGAAIRWAHLVGANLSVGVFAFLVLVARPAATAAGSEALLRLGPLDRRLLRLAIWGLALTLSSGLLDLWRQTVVATGLGLRESLAPTAFGAVLLSTRYGTVWLIQHALIALAVVVLLLAEEADRWDWLALRLEMFGLTAVSLVVLSVAGHAASAQSVPNVAIAVDAVHLLATGVWFGALIPLALFLQWTRALPAEPATRIAARATQRFSMIGLGSVGLLIGTGLINTWEQVGSFPGLVGTPYGRGLSLKLGLLVLLIGIAAVNHLHLKPRLRRASVAGVRDDAAIRQLRHNVVGEAILGAAILGVVGWIGLSTPARHEQVVWPFTVRLSWAATKGLPGVVSRVAMGSQLGVLGVVAVGLAVILRRSGWRRIVAVGAGAMALGLAVALPPLGVDAYPTTYLNSTVPYTAGSIAAGLELYRTHCAVCHGNHGYGDGPAAVGLRPRPADLTAKHAADHTVGDMFWWLTRGIRGSAMPGFADRLTAEQRWDLINVIRTLAAGERARTLGPTVQPTPWLVAPDFTYTPGIGESRSLKDSRGVHMVLLVFFTLPQSGPRLSALNTVYGLLRGAGTEILAVSLRAERNVYRTLGDRLLYFPIVVDGALEAAQAYILLQPDPEAPPPGHLEFLIDRQGYIRARWGSIVRPGWEDPSRLLTEIQRLAKEPARAPAPDVHVH